MKTKQFITGVLTFLAIYCFTLAFTGCSNDDDDQVGQTSIDYRVSEIISTEISGSDVYEDKALYNYIDERLMEVIDLDKENGVWEEDRKTAYNYEGDWVYSSRYNKDGDDWVEQNYGSTEGIKIVNGRVVEVRYTNTFMGYVYNSIFTYNGDKLVKIERFNNGDLRGKYVFTYNGENLQEVLEYEYDDGIEELDYKYEFSYSGGNLSEILELYYKDDAWVNSDKEVYLYSGNKVIQIDDYDYDNDSWELDDSEFFSYNSLGLLESISQRGEGWTEEEIYTYEEGVGNYRLLEDEGDWYYFNYPTAQKTVKPESRPDDRKFNLKRFLVH